MRTVACERLVPQVAKLSRKSKADQKKAEKLLKEKGQPAPSQHDWSEHSQQELELMEQDEARAPAAHTAPSPSLALHTEPQPRGGAGVAAKVRARCARHHRRVHGRRWGDGGGGAAAPGAGGCEARRQPTRSRSYCDEQAVKVALVQQKISEAVSACGRVSVPW